MTSLQELYGDKYQDSFIQDNQEYVAGLLVSNIAARNFSEVKHDFSVLFANNSKQISNQWFQYIKNKVENMNQFLILTKITDYRELPKIIPEQQITYIKVIDKHSKKIYIIFITPYIMDVF